MGYNTMSFTTQEHLTQPRNSLNVKKAEQVKLKNENLKVKRKIISMQKK